jgi:hypothetical protein
MAIVTRDEVKTFLQISGTAEDSLIDALIPQAEQAYKKLRAIPYFDFTGSTTAASDQITDIVLDDFDCIEEGLLIENKENGIREKITKVDVDNRLIEVENVIGSTLADIDFIIYPNASQLVASKIVQYFMDLDNMDGLKSESTGNYNREIDVNIAGLPRNIANMIDQYSTGYR